MQPQAMKMMMAELKNWMATEMRTVMTDYMRTDTGPSERNTEPTAPSPSLTPDNAVAGSSKTQTPSPNSFRGRQQGHDSPGTRTTESPINAAHQEPYCEESPSYEPHPYEDDPERFDPPAVLPPVGLPQVAERRIIPDAARVAHDGTLVWEGKRFHPAEVELSTHRDGSISIEIAPYSMSDPDMLALHSASTPLTDYFPKASEDRVRSCLAFLDGHISAKTGWTASNRENTVKVSKSSYQELYQDIDNKVCTGAKLASQNPALVFDSELDIFKFLQGPRLDNSFNYDDPTLSGAFNNIKGDEFATESFFRQRASQAIKILETLGTVNSTLGCLTELTQLNPPATLNSKLTGVSKLMQLAIDSMKDLTSFHLHKALSAKMSLRLKAVGGMEPEAVRKKLTTSALTQPTLFSKTAMDETAPIVANLYHINFRPAQKRPAPPPVDPTARKKTRFNMPQPPLIRPSAPHYFRQTAYHRPGYSNSTVNRPRYSYNVSTRPPTRPFQNQAPTNIRGVRPSAPRGRSYDHNRVQTGPPRDTKVTKRR